MLLITTPTGNTGRHVLHAALAVGEDTRVLVRDPSRLAAEAQGRCDIVQGDLRDPAVLARALDGAEGVFFCVPQSADLDDLNGYYRSFADPFVRAAKAAGVRRIVYISGGDGQGSGDRGPGLSLSQVERAIDATGIAARHVRCGYFMENLFYQLMPITRAGVFALPIAGQVPLPFVAARGIGAVAARLLLDRTWAGSDAVAAYGPANLSCDTAAAIAAGVRGVPVRHEAISGATYRANLAPNVSVAMSRSLVEMFEAIADGQDMAAPVAHRAECPTTLQAWMEEELKPAFRGL